MSKLSDQFVGADNDDTGDVSALAAAHPAVFKSVNSYRHANVMHSLSPNTLVIIRDMTVGESLFEGLDPTKVSAKDAAKLWFDHMLPFMTQAPYAYFEGPYNEWGDWPNLSWLGALEAERVRLLASAGLKACVGNFSAEGGVVVAAQIKDFLPAITACNRYGGILGLHGYNSPRLDSADSVQFLFPHRTIRAALGVLGIPMPSMVYTEFGIDHILSIPGHAYDGWLKVPNLSGQEYMNQLAWADGEMAKEADVLGATVYAYFLGPYAEEAYNIARPRKTGSRDYEPYTVAGLLTAYVAAHPGGIVVPPPVTPPPVEPPPVTPPSAESVLLFESHFDDFAHYFAASDTNGDRMIPLGFFLGFKTGPAFVTTHSEYYPPQKIAPRPNALRFQWQGKGHQWQGAQFPSTPGKTYRLTTQYTVKVAAGAGTVQVRAVADLAGGVDPTVKGLPFQPEVLTVTATGQKTTFIWDVYADTTQRFNADLSLFKVEELPSIIELPPPPVTPPPLMPGKYFVTGAVSWLNVRVAPNTSAAIIGKALVGATILVDEFVIGESISGNAQWARVIVPGIQIGLYLSAAYLKTAP
jgi:hypothetical protein